MCLIRGRGGGLGAKEILGVVVFGGGRAVSPLHTMCIKYNI